MAGAYRDRAHALGLDDVLGDSVTLTSAAGEALHEDDSVIAGAFDHVVDQRSAVDITAQVDGQAMQIPDVLSATVRTKTAVAVAPMVTLTVSEPAPFVGHYGLSIAQRLFGSSSYEGSLFEVKDTSGKVGEIAGYASRTGKGVWWSPSSTQLQHNGVSIVPPTQ